MTARIFTVCGKCSSPLATLMWCETRDDNELRILWQCPTCANEFETIESCVETSGKLKEAMDVFWPTLLVA